jgi:hypothetical protein
MWVTGAGMSRQFGAQSTDRSRGRASDIRRIALQICRGGICVATRITTPKPMVTEQIHPEAGSVARCSRPEILSVLTSETRKNRKKQEKQ